MANLFGKNLKEIRKEYGISQKDLAEELEFTNNQISDWEIGRAIPNIEQVYKLAKFFKIKIDKFLKEEDDEYGIRITNSFNNPINSNIQIGNNNISKK